LQSPKTNHYAAEDVILSDPKGSRRSRIFAVRSTAPPLAARENGFFDFANAPLRMTTKELPFTRIDGLHKLLQLVLWLPVDSYEFSTLSTAFSTG
jgi:hypothetical protein